jgi:hypothetical protein
MKPLTATTHLFAFNGTHRAGARGAQNDRDPFGRQMQFGIVRKKLNSKNSIVRCGNDVCHIVTRIGEGCAKPP